MFPQSGHRFKPLHQEKNHGKNSSDLGCPRAFWSGGCARLCRRRLARARADATRGSRARRGAGRRAPAMAGRRAQRHGCTGCGRSGRHRGRARAQPRLHAQGLAIVGPADAGLRHRAGPCARRHADAAGQRLQLRRCNAGRAGRGHAAAGADRQGPHPHRHGTALAAQWRALGRGARRRLFRQWARHLVRPGHGEGPAQGPLCLPGAG